MRDRTTQRFAKQLRSQTTDAERYLWRHLRRRNIGNYRFRRQVPIGRYIVDFACSEAKLIVELDGSQHSQQLGYDRRRDTWIEAKGFRVLRFWDDQVFQETAAVLDVISVALASAPSPTLPRAARKGGRS